MHPTRLDSSPAGTQFPDPPRGWRPQSDLRDRPGRLPYFSDSVDLLNSYLVISLPSPVCAKRRNRHSMIRIVSPETARLQGHRKQLTTQRTSRMHRQCNLEGSGLSTVLPRGRCRRWRWGRRVASNLHAPVRVSKHQSWTCHDTGCSPASTAELFEFYPTENNRNPT